MIWLLMRFAYYVLAAIASYGAYRFSPQDQPYAFAACAISIINGVYGLVGGHELDDSVVTDVIDNLSDFAPLALMNIQISKGLGKPYAYVHGMFVIPLVLALIATLFGEESDCFATQTLGHVCNMANVVGTIYLAIVSKNYKLCAVALPYLLAQVGTILKGKCQNFMVDLNYVLNYSLFYLMSIWAMSVQKGVESSNGGPSETKAEAPAEAPAE